MLNTEKISHENITDLSTHMSDVATVPWEIPQKSLSTVFFIRNSDYLRYLSVHSGE